jgi:DNA-binding IclR family transcriptional regulator
MEEGVRCVAALVADHRGEPAGVVSISGAAMRIAPPKIKFFAKSVIECSQAISMDLGFNPPHPALSPRLGERVRVRGYA